MITRTDRGFLLGVSSFAFITGVATFFLGVDQGITSVSLAGVVVMILMATLWLRAYFWLHYIIGKPGRLAGIPGDAKKLGPFLVWRQVR